MGKKFLVIGVGRFGKSVLKGLHKQGREVVGVDKNPQILDDIQEFTSYVASGDATENSFLDEMNVEDFDSVVVSMGDNFEAAVLIVKKLKDRHCKNIIVKANDYTRGEVLSAVGADRVVYPEEETGFRIAKQIANPSILEQIELSPHFSGLEMKIPKSFVGKNLAQLNFRQKYGLTVVLIQKKHSEDPIISPLPDEMFEKEDVIFVVGENDDIERFKKVD